MGNYLTYEALERRITSERLEALGQLTGDSLLQLVNEVINRAEALIEGFAIKRYQLPLSPGNLLEEWSLCIVEYELYKRGPGNSVPEKIRESYNHCMEQLNQLAAGLLQLPGEKPLSGINGKSLLVPDHENFFDPESMRNY